MDGDPGDPHHVPLHALGHASEEDLAHFVRAVRPQVPVPVHTERPERWQDLVRGTGIQVRVPRPGEAWVYG